jgi:hypothetical protein
LILSGHQPILLSYLISFGNFNNRANYRSFLSHCQYNTLRSSGQSKEFCQWGGRITLWNPQEWRWNTRKV